MSDKLKIETKSGIILFDSTWIAGVDYDVNQNHDNDNENKENDDEEVENIENIDNTDEMDPNDILGEDNPVEINQIDDKNTVENDPNVNEEVEEVAEINENEEIEQNDKEINEYNEIEQNDNEINEEEINEEYDEPMYDFDAVPEGRTTRSGRTSRAPDRLIFLQHNLFTQGHKKTEYTEETAKVIAKIIHHYNNTAFAASSNRELSFLETYSLNKGLKHFGDKGYKAAFDKVRQLHERSVFKPINVSDLTQLERKRAMESLIFLVVKRDGRIKSRACANGSTQREYINKEESASPTVATESVLITAAMEAEEERDIMSADIPNAFVQTNMEVNGNEKMMMKIRGPLVTMLIELDPDLYSPFVVEENGNTVLYVQLLKALYGTLQASLLFYKKLVNDLSGIGFEINPYNPCIANRVINGKQHTITWHVDDIKVNLRHVSQLPK
jgi:Reverse transcriptase (RNA-dependent DNA polymerase)